MLFLNFLTASASLSKLFNLGGQFYEKLNSFKKSNGNILEKNLEGLKEVREKGRVQKEEQKEEKDEKEQKEEQKDEKEQKEQKDETEAEPQRETEKDENETEQEKDEKNENTTNNNNPSLLPTTTSLPPTPNKYTSHPHLKNQHSHTALQKTLKAQKKAHHLKNTKIKQADLNYVKDKIKRNHNSHVHRVGSYANRAYYTYFSYHPGLRQSQWVFHNGHHGVVRGWHDVEDE